MNRKIVAAVVGGVLSFAAVQPVAQASLATDLSTKVADKIVSAVLGKAAGKAIDFIFGGNDSGLTKADVEDAINQAFEKATVQDIKEGRQALVNRVEVYNPRSADALDSVRDITADAGDLQALIQTHINKDNSMVAIPAFIAAWNTRLAFLAERYRISGDVDDKHNIAISALRGLGYLNEYLRNDFRDNIRGTSPCIKKDTDTHLRINGAVGINYTEKFIDVATYYCLGNGRVLKSEKDLKWFKGHTWSIPRASNVVNLNGAWYMRTTDMGKAMHENLWLFAGRMGDTGNEYFLEQSPSEEWAHMRRNQYILKHYVNEIGDLHATVLAWMKIIKATHDPETPQMRTAMKTAAQLGVGWMTVAFFGGTKESVDYVKQEVVAPIRQAGEQREISDNETLHFNLPSPGR